MLTGTPYLFESDPAAKAIADELADLDAHVSLLRAEGQLDDDTLARLRSEWRVEQVYETTGIEGSQLDLNETRLVLTRGVTITGKPLRDSADAINMKEALDFLETLAQVPRALAATDLRQLQSLVLGGGPGAGEYRGGSVTISGSEHVPPSAPAVPGEVDEALAWLASSRAPAPLRAAVVHAWLAQIHPFVDGNGRTARAVMNLVLIREGYPIALIRRRDRPRYYDALSAADGGDIGPLVSLIIKRSLDSLRQIARIRAAESGLTEVILRARQAARAEYETWSQAMTLLLKSIEEIALRINEEASGALEIRLKEYSQVTAEDYLALKESDPSGNGWLAVIAGSSPSCSKAELLLWVGFRSDEFRRDTGSEGAGASVFFSERDPTGAKPFRSLGPARTDGVPFREIAYDGDRYHVLLRGPAGLEHIRLGASELASRLLQTFIVSYLTPDVARKD